MKKNEYDIIVIGGGPSGMMAAGRAGELGAKVLLIEKNNRLGKKLSLTGGRRCNLTNAEPDNRLFLDNFPESKKYLFSSLSQFNVEDTFRFFEDRGLPIIIEDKKRAFPKSEKAEDVCRVLTDYIKESHQVEVKLNTALVSFVVNDGKLKGIETTSGVFYAPQIILATGGFAAPETGSTGEGVLMLSAIGHTVRDPDPNLVPLKTSAKWVHKLSGVSVDDVALKFIQKDKVQHKVNGRILFTHFGISGPTVINVAHVAKMLLKKGSLTASIDLFPDHDLKSLDELVRELLERHSKKQLKRVIKELMPKKLGETIFETIKPDIAKVLANSLTKEQRKLLISTLKDLRFPITGTMGLDWSIVADGGVVLKEVNFKTMTSKLFPNLYLIGDTININRPSGGFSLQLCWTMGWIAGTCAASSMQN
ncbi:NAD(P)/FAD-dependent oxidoreductase [Patescibacteria group bacterium]